MTAWRAFRLKLLVNTYPPLWAAGIRTQYVANDFSRIDVKMGLHFWNRNYVGTQFGGSLYAMTDPFHMLMLIERLGPAYTVWDKAATIRFRKPGRGTVFARFELLDPQVREIRKAADAGQKLEPTFTIHVTNNAGEIVAEVEKRLYVKKR